MTTSTSADADSPTETLVADFKARFPAAYRLAVCASLAARVEPELLRALRFELLPGADAGAEADVWLSPLVAYRSAGALEFDRGVSNALRQELALAENRSLLEAAHRVVARVHEHLPSALQAEETITWLALAGGETTSSQINAILQSMMATMATDMDRRLDIARWAAGGLQRLPASAQSSEAARSVSFAAGTILNRPQLLGALPGSGASWSALAAVLPPNLGEVSVGIQLVENGVVITDPGSAAHTLSAPGTTPVVLEVAWRRDDTRWSQVVGWESGQSHHVTFPADASDPAASITVRTINGKVFSLRAAASPQPSTPTISVGPAVERTRTRRALLVGINQYAHLPGLQGCAEDAVEVGRFLREELEWAEVQTLVDSHATADSIRRAFIELLSTGPGDEIWVYYAGHGRRGTTNGRPDFVLLAADATDILDDKAPGQLHADELTQYLTRASVGGARVTLVLDTIGAGPDADDNTWVPRDSRFDELVVLAASRADQRAYDMALPSGRRTGALTDAVLRTLQQLSADVREQATWLHVYPMVRARVEALFPQQTPALIGRAERPVFGGEWDPGEAGHAVVQTVPGVYAVAVAPRDNLQVGDTLEVLATSSGQPPDAPLRRQGFLELTEVGLAVATAHASGTPFQLELGARAHEVRGRATLMRVALVTPSASLQALLDSSPLLRVVRSDDPEAQVYVDGSADRGWVIRNATEPQVARIFGQEYALLNALNAYWRYNTVLQLASRPALEFSQCGVSARLVRHAAEGAADLPVDPATGEAAIPSDYPFSVALDEHSGSNAYVTVLLCTADGGVNQLLTLPELPANGSLRTIGIRSVPADYQSKLHYVAVFVGRGPLPDLLQLETPATQLALQPTHDVSSTDLFGDSSATWSATLLPLHVGEQYRWDLSGLLSAVIAQVGMRDAGVLLSIAGMSFNLVPGEGKDALIKRIVAAVSRRGTVDTLVAAIRQLFPTVDVDAYELVAQAQPPAQPTEAPPGTPAEEAETSATAPSSTAESEALGLLRSEDPLDALTAIAWLSNNAPPSTAPLQVPQSPVSQAAARRILAAHPDLYARVILNRIAASGPTGDSWGEAHSAASLASPALREYLEPELLDLINVGPEVSRHALTALGEIGAAGAHALEVVAAMTPGYADKRLPFALDAAARSFELAVTASEIFANAELMVRLDELRAKLVPSTRSPLPTLRECDLQHIDAATQVFLTSQVSSVVGMGLSVVENVLDVRAAEAVLKVALTASDEGVRRRAVQTVWRLGDFSARDRMRSSLEPPLALEGVEFGLEFVDDSREFDSWLQTALEHPQRFMALRAVALRARTDHLRLLYEELRGSDALTRGCAALALARLGDAEPVRQAYVSATQPAERVFAALGLLSVHAVDYDSLAAQLRQDLRTSVVGYLPELQADILDVLSTNQHPEATALGQAWAPFCFAAARRRFTARPGPRAA